MVAAPASLIGESLLATEFSGMGTGSGTSTNRSSDAN